MNDGDEEEEEVEEVAICSHCGRSVSELLVCDQQHGFCKSCALVVKDEEAGTLEYACPECTG